jgi:uncharacterized protein YjdB
MAEPFVVVDLASSSRDFQPIALEPGMPMLDRLKSSYKTLRLWLRDYAAEPEISAEGNSVGFLIPLRVRDGEAPGATGERPVVDACVPVTVKDLRGPLRKELDTLRALIEKVSPKTATERALKRSLDTALKTQLDPRNEQPGFHLYKYKGPDGKLRLAWCWGFQRRDDSPSTPAVYKSRLYALRPGERLSDRLGAGVDADGAPAPRRRHPLRAAVLALMLIAAIAGGIWFGRPYLRAALDSSGKHPIASTSKLQLEKLVVSPETWKGPVGARIDFSVKHFDSKGKESDASRRAVATSDDPRVVEFGKRSAVATAAAPGQTTLHFSLGRLSTQVTIKVEPPRNPAKLAIEPKDATLGVGTTARLKLVGEYDGGEKIDLTDRAEWSSRAESVVFCYRGQLEGLAEGVGQVRARYRATPESPYVEALAEIKVTPKDYRSLEIAIAPQPLVVGKASELKALAVEASGEKQSVTQSSLLKIEIDPPSLAELDGSSLVGKAVGKGKLTATFLGKLTAKLDFEVVAPEGSALAELVVAPKVLKLAVGEVAKLTVSGPEGNPEITSADPKIAAVSDDGRVAAKATGETKLEISQAGKKASVPVTVVEAPLRSIAIVPDRIQVGINDKVPVKVIGKGDGDRQVELAPDRLTWERVPSSRVVDFDPSSLTVRGLSATGAAPQSLSVRVGDLRAAARVEVVSPPFTLEVTPKGPVTLPVGQSARLQAFANYGDGRRIEILGDGLEWIGNSAAGLKLSSNGTVEALSPGSEAMTVRARYQGKDSNAVLIHSEAPAPATLAVKAPRAVILVGETGALTLSAEDPKGPVALSDRSGKFTSSDPTVLAVDPVTGAYRALRAGRASVTGQHPAAPSPATADLRVVDPSKANLVFRPEELKIPIGTIAELKLFLVTTEDGKETLTPLGDETPVRYILGSNDAVQWKPPLMTGLKRSPLFYIAAKYLKLAALAKIQVVPAAAADGRSSALRVVPSTARLGAGQTVTPKVEMFVAGTKDTWNEVRPDLVRWQLPAGVTQTPATRTVRPSFGIAPSASGMKQLSAEYESQKASLSLTPGGGSVTTNLGEPGGRSLIRRQPGGETLFAGEQQRYAVVNPKGEGDLPADKVEWPASFENEFVKWDAPVLTAKKPGYTARLWAKVGDQKIPFQTVIIGKPTGDFASRPGRRTFRDGRVGFGGVGPGAFGRWSGVGVPRGVTDPRYYWGWRGSPWGWGTRRGVGGITDLRGLADEDIRRDDRILPLPEGAPKSVTITSREGSTLAIPQGVTSREYKVEAQYETGPPRDVTDLAALSIEGETVNPPVAARDGGLTGNHPGTATVQATFQGVKSQAGLRVDVTDKQAIDALKLQPTNLTLAVGETASLQVIAYSQGNPVGEATDLSRLVWKSRDAEILRVDGPQVTGLKVGVAGVTVQDGAVVSNVAEVTVVDRSTSVGDRLQIAPEAITLSVGETRHLGTDITVLRGGSDFSRQCDAKVASDDVVRFDSRSRTITGVSPGRTEAVFTFGDQHASLDIEVLPAAELTGNETLVIEPSSDVLDVGESKGLRVYQTDAAGRRIDRTTSATWDVTGDAVELRGSAARGIKPGEAAISAHVAGVKASATAKLSVRDQQVTGLSVFPGRLSLVVGERKPIVITGTGGSRRVTLTEHPDLKLTAEGPNPDAIEIIGASEVVGRAAGQATLRVRWRDSVEATVPVDVSASAVSGLVLEPADAVIEQGETVLFKVFADRGGSQAALGADDGVDLTVDQPGVARRLGGLEVKGIAPGTTEVTARVGNRRVSARLTVTEASRAEPPRVLGGGSLRFRPESLRLTPGTAGELVALFKDTPDGAVEDVSGIANLTVVDGDGVVQVTPTASGPVIKPLKSGRATIRGAVDQLTTARLLVVDVAPAEQGLARLVVAPDPLILRPGESGSFRRVEVVPGPGRDPVPVGFKVAAGPGISGVAEVAGASSLRGIKEGRGQVSVTAVDPGGAFDGLQTSASVEIVGAAANPQQDLDLVLSGPSQTTVGSEVRFRAELRGADSSRFVELDGTNLVLEEGQGALADVRPGCALFAKKPGKVVVQAQRGGLVSNRLELQISPVADAFQRLSIEVDRRPLAVGEARPFRIWGEPGAGEAIQDLTGLATDDPDDPKRPYVSLTPAPPAEGTVATRQGRNIVGKAPGRVTLQASLGPGLQSEPITLQVVAATGSGALAVNPDTLVVRVGERLPAVTVTARVPGEATPRSVEATLKSLDEAILAPDPRVPGQFVGRAAGQARVQATFGDQTANANVTVLPNRFETVRIVGGPHKDGTTFDVDVEVTAPHDNAELEYRAFKDGDPGDSGWVKAQNDGDRMRVRLKSPKYTLSPAALYEMTIEARDGSGRAPERFVLPFRLIKGEEYRIESSHDGPRTSAVTPAPEFRDDAIPEPTTIQKVVDARTPRTEVLRRPALETRGEGFGDTRFGRGIETVQGVDVKIGDPQITLIWDGLADLDLHVQEPAGAHLFFQNPRGAQGGELDVDNTIGFGPENVYWPTDGAVGGPPGVYKWYVHYYAGTQGYFGPVRWKVRVKHHGQTTYYRGQLNGVDDRTRTYSFKFGG